MRNSATDDACVRLNERHGTLVRRESYGSFATSQGDSVTADLRCDLPYARSMRHLVWVVLTACVIIPSSQQQQPQYAQPQGGAQVASTTSECVQIFQCMAGCNDDNLCQLGCLQRGSPEGRQNATALIRCGQANGCQPEASCLWAHCEAEA